MERLLCCSRGDGQVKNVEVTVDENTNDHCYYDEHSRTKNYEDRMLFVFDYRGNQKGGGCIHWTHLRDLIDRGKWKVIRHPMVLHFVNERLIECAPIYFLYISAFIAYLLILSCHIFSKDLIKDVAITLLSIFFIISLLFRGYSNARISRSINALLIIAYSSNIMAFVATLAYVWLPHLYKHNYFNESAKPQFLVYLPVVAVMSAWVNFVLILRKGFWSTFGIYGYMMARILKSFVQIATIWIPTLIAFSFAFYLIFRDSKVEPWENSDANNATLLTLLQSVTKTSTMMLGEIDVDDIIGTKQWIPSIILLVFEIIAVILLMNLMVSLAVDDVMNLRKQSDDKISTIKLNFLIEALQISEAINMPCLSSLHLNRTDNIFSVFYSGGTCSAFDERAHKFLFDGEEPKDDADMLQAPVRSSKWNKATIMRAAKMWLMGLTIEMPLLLAWSAKGELNEDKDGVPLSQQSFAFLNVRGDLVLINGRTKEVLMRAKRDEELRDWLAKTDLSDCLG